MPRLKNQVPLECHENDDEKTTAKQVLHLTDTSYMPSHNVSPQIP